MSEEDKMICTQWYDRGRKEAIEEFLAEYDNFIEVIQGIEFQCGFRSIPFTDKLKNKIKKIKSKREKWEERLKCQ